MVALGNRDPGHLEKVRTRMGQWVTAGDEEEANLGLEDLGEGKEWEGWDEVLLAWAGVGAVAASMRMVWADRNPQCGGRWRWHWWSCRLGKPGKGSLGGGGCGV